MRTAIKITNKGEKKNFKFKKTMPTYVVDLVRQKKISLLRDNHANFHNEQFSC